MTYRRIVIGVDFATASLAAVRWAVSTFGRRARMLLVHVAPGPRRQTFAKPHLSEIDVLHAAPTGTERPDLRRGETAPGKPVVYTDKKGRDWLCEYLRLGERHFGKTDDFADATHSPAASPSRGTAKYTSASIAFS